MVQEAEQHAEEDRLKREEVQTVNTAENTAYTAEKMVKENEDKIPDDLKTEIEGKITALRSAIEAKDISGIQSAMQELHEALQRVGELVYSQTGDPGDGQAPPEGPEGPGGEEPPEETPEGTVEGEFREV